MLVSEKNWHKELFEKLSSIVPGEWLHIDRQELLTVEQLSVFQPDKIFFPHWSCIIPGDLFETYECIVFHMTDLPFGRGGSPLQNLISRGIYETKVSALKVTKGIDTGDIYLKKPLSLFGTAEEIYKRTSDIIGEMIVEIIRNNAKPVPQEGTVVAFPRRKPEDGNIADLESIQKVFDFIRMLDAKGYPNAFVEIGNFRLEFSRASIQNDNSILADVRIIQK